MSQGAQPEQQSIQQAPSGKIRVVVDWDPVTNAITVGGPAKFPLVMIDVLSRGIHQVTVFARKQQEQEVKKGSDIVIPKGVISERSLRVGPKR